MCKTHNRAFSKWRKFWLDTVIPACIGLGALTLLLTTSTLVQAQVFADIKDALVDYTKADIKPGRTCDSLNNYKAQELVRIKTEKIAAAGPVPEFCRVTGLLSPEIAFEVSLPARWNGRFYMFGNGGLAGQALDSPYQVAQRNAALQNGFATAQTNTGHDANKEPGGTFVLSNPQKGIDYAYRAVHLTAVTAGAITSDYYGKPASRSYWNSCSNGGRQGLIEAQRYPDDFDGIVANAPWLDPTGFTIGVLWNQKALSAAPVTEDQLLMVADKVMTQCDAIDGLEDGLIDDPRRCNFDPARDAPSCSTNKAGKQCLTPAQAQAIAKVYGGPVSKGKHIFPGFEPGSEAKMNLFGGGTGSGWMKVIISSQPDVNSMDFDLGENIMRYLVHKPPQPDYDYRTFDFDRDIHMLDDWGKVADADNPDLSVFRKHGGKLIMTHGWADAVLQPRVSIDYYEQAVTVNGSDTKNFFRLFMIPGMAHCWGGTGPDQHDSMTAIINWVEQGRAPDSIVARQITDNKVVRTRPLCPYPKVARYIGQGSIDDAASFRCVVP